MSGSRKGKKGEKNTIRTGGAAHLVLFTPGAGLGKLNKHVLPPPRTTCCMLQPGHVILPIILIIESGGLTSVRLYRNHFYITYKARRWNYSQIQHIVY